MICSCGKEVAQLHPKCVASRASASGHAATGAATREKLCVVCGKKVGNWHANGVHPSCLPKMEKLWDERGIGARLSQSQRDAILRGVNTGRSR